MLYTYVENYTNFVHGTLPKSILASCPSLVINHKFVLIFRFLLFKFKKIKVMFYISRPPCIITIYMRIVVVKTAAKKPRLLSFHFFLLSFFLEQWGRDRVQTRRVRRRCRHVQGQSSRRVVLRMRSYVHARMYVCVCVVVFFLSPPPESFATTVAASSHAVFPGRRRGCRRVQ